jgi:hypothetical protein
MSSLDRQFNLRLIDNLSHNLDVGLIGDCGHNQFANQSWFIRDKNSNRIHLAPPSKGEVSENAVPTARFKSEGSMSLRVERSRQGKDYDFRGRGQGGKTGELVPHKTTATGLGTGYLVMFLQRGTRYKRNFRSELCTLDTAQFTRLIVRPTSLCHQLSERQCPASALTRHWPKVCFRFDVADLRRLLVPGCVNDGRFRGSVAHAG